MVFDLLARLHAEGLDRRSNCSYDLVQLGATVIIGSIGVVLERFLRGKEENDFSSFFFFQGRNQL